MNHKTHLKRAIKHARKHLRQRGFQCDGGMAEVAKLLIAHELVDPKLGYKRAVLEFYSYDMKLTATGLLPSRTVKSFYYSPEWKRLARWCKSRDGRKCMRCGATPDDGVRIVSDHIISVRSDWSRRLDPDNIQTLCDSCNWEKGSLDFTDYRKKQDFVGSYG